jgi:hydrogenase 3 maturation protease
VSFSFKGLRVAALGIGNELNGDDAAGVLVARALQERLVSKDHQKITGQAAEEYLILEAGPAPENFAGSLRRFRPDLILMIDAAQMDQPPGSVTWVDWRDVEGFGGSTHVLSPSALAEYLMRELDCKVMFIGIQPQSLEFLAPLSEPVEQAVARLVDDLLVKFTTE